MRGRFRDDGGNFLSQAKARKRDITDSPGSLDITSSSGGTLSTDHCTLPLTISPMLLDLMRGNASLSDGESKAMHWAGIPLRTFRPFVSRFAQICQIHHFSLFHSKPMKSNFTMEYPNH